MSTSYSMVYGKVIRLKDDTVVTKKVYSRCVNEKCSRFDLGTDHKFCPSCGELVFTSLVNCKLLVIDAVYGYIASFIPGGSEYNAYIHHLGYGNYGEDGKKTIVVDYTGKHVDVPFEFVRADDVPPVKSDAWDAAITALDSLGVDYSVDFGFYLSVG